MSGRAGRRTPQRVTALVARGTIAALLLSVLLGCGSHHSGGPSAATGSVGAATPSTQFPDPATSTLALGSALQAVLDTAVSSKIAPGMTAAVVTRDGVWTAASGASGNGKRLDPHSALAIGSITKTFTAAEILRLAEQHRIDLKAKLSSYVKLPVPDNGATVLDALGMRSGIPDLPEETTDPLVAATVAPDRRLSWDQLQALVPKTVNAPDKAFAYSDVNYILLGQIIEKATGTSYAHALRSDLLDNAGLQRIFVQDEERPTAPVGTSWPALAGSGRYLPNRKIASAVGAAGCIAADAASVARWGYLLFGGHVLQPASLTAMLGDPGANYALGNYSQHLLNSDAKVVGHNGAINGFRSQLWVDREHQIAVAVLVATDHDADPSGVADDLLAVLLHR
jgi:D-alanyl-D-alanine carboxypeptidase